MTFPIRSFTARLKPFSDKKSFHFQKKCCRWTPHRVSCSASIDKNLPQSTPHLTCLFRAASHKILLWSACPAFSCCSLLTARNLSQQKSPELQLSRMIFKVTHPFFYNNLSLLMVSAAVSPHPGLGHSRGRPGGSTGCSPCPWAGMHPAGEQEGSIKDRSTEDRHPRKHGGNSAKKL